MIRRIVEYIIICDSERLRLGECYTGATAYNAAHYEECEQGARRDHWKQISKRLWLCPAHAEEFEKLVAGRRDHGSQSTGGR